MPRTEVIDIFSKTVRSSQNKDKNKKVIITQRGNVIAIKKKAGATKEEIPQSQNVFKESAVRYANYKRAVMKGSTSSMSQTRFCI